MTIKRSDRFVRVLLLGARRRVFLIERLRIAASALDKELFLLCADTDDLDPTIHFCDEFAIIPSSSDPSYVMSVASLIEEWRIDITVPWNDKDIWVINNHRDTAFAPFVFSLPSCDVTRLFLDKLKFAEWCASNSVPHPRVFGIEDAPTFPCIVKPRFGQGSVGVTICQDRTDYLYGIKHAESPIVQELVTGQEFTVDVYCWPVSKVFACVPRLRIKTRGGEVLIAKIVSDRFAKPLAEVIARSLNIEGLFNFQYIVAGDRPYVIEANPRMGGGTDLSIAAGVDIPLYLIERLMTGNLTSLPPIIREGLVMSRFHKAVFFAQEGVLPTTAVSPPLVDNDRSAAIDP